MDWPLYWRLPPKADVTSDTLLDKFLDYVTHIDLTLYPAQEEAILALFEDQNVVLNTPTGSGKSLVASALCFHALANGRRAYYTCPIKALVNEKFRDLCDQFGPEQVGLITGDGSVNAQAPIICCTAEILANLAAREGDQARVDDVVMDEFHYYADKQRGVAWQIPLLALPQARFLLMSATLGDVDTLAERVQLLTRKPCAVVVGEERPVPLEFSYRETPLHETVADLLGQGRGPIYLVNFSQREAAEEAQNLMSVNFASKEEKAAVAASLNDVQFKSPYGRDLEKFLRHGIGLHHAGLLPKYRALVERLAQRGLLKVISGTDTLGVGVNVPIRAVLFTKLCKYDGEKTALLTAREFHQISGRAGRRGFDQIGFVVAQAPAHVIENLKLKAKAAADPKRARKLVLRTPPPHGFVMWTADTFNKLVTAKPEALTPRFEVSHGLLLNVLSRPNGVKAMRRLIADSHGSDAHKRGLRRHAFQLVRALLERKIIEVIPGTRELQVNVSLQEDFSLNHSLALYLVDTVKLLDPGDPNYGLDVLTLAESILESPDLILRRQLDRAKDQKMAEMKASGVEYEERMEELEKLEWPKPKREFIYETFNAFSAAHPWVGQENIRPKSIAREMFENYYTFAEYVREYDLRRAEGVLLRYLTEVYKVLEQTVPPGAQDEVVRDIAGYFGQMVRDVDSSLLEDWQARLAGAAVGLAAEDPAKARAIAAAAAEKERVQDEAAVAKAFARHLRGRAHAFVRALALGQFEEALEIIDPAKEGGAWSAADLEAERARHQAEHGSIAFDPAARHPRWTEVKPGAESWSIEQRLIDPEGANDWVAEFVVAPPTATNLNLARPRLIGLREI